MTRPRFTVVQEEDGNEGEDKAKDEDKAGVKDKDEGACDTKSVFDKVDFVMIFESLVPVFSFVQY